jgi:hypothetical protein
MRRRLLLSILKRETSLKDSLRGKRLRAGRDEDMLLKILTGLSGT